MGEPPRGREQPHHRQSGHRRWWHPHRTRELARAIRRNQFRYVDSRNWNLTIHHNEIVQNGNTAGNLVGGGGGVSLFNGADGYRVTENFICGNYSTGDGGGIAHIGFSKQGRVSVPTIERNMILFNQSFNQGTNPNGGGLAISGLQSLVAANPVGLSAGTGTVLVNANTFQGNLAGAGDGGAISLYGVNGSDATTAAPHRIDIFNNVIDNNVAGVAAGGIALQDAINVRIINNTITRNDSVATGSRAFQGRVDKSEPQPGAGVMARTHSPAFAGIVGAVSVNGLPQQSFSNPVLHNSIVQNNRMFFWQVTPGTDPNNCLLNTATQNCYGLVPNIDGGEAPVFSDLAVIGGAYQLTASHSMLTPPQAMPPLFPQPIPVPGPNNLTSDPMFRCTYYNGGRDAVIQQTEVTAIVTAAAFDEGGNFIDARFGPLTTLNPLTLAPYGDYRILDGSPANNSALADPLIPALGFDRIRVPRNPLWSRGAYEGAQGVPVCGP